MRKNGKNVTANSSMRYRAHKVLSIFPPLALLSFFIPVVAGICFTFLPALEYLPALGEKSISLKSLTNFLHHPSTPGAIRVTFFSGMLSTLLAVLGTYIIIISSHSTSMWKHLHRFLAPLLAFPHAAFAIGFGFLIAPSGLLMRFISPELSGIDAPPDWSIVKDPHGMCLTFALACKEIPFLLFMAIGAISQLDINKILWVGRSLGYSPLSVWNKLIIPQIYPQLRLPVFAVLAYSFSVVDLAMILGPTTPPTLSVLINSWFNDPDIHMRFQGAAGASCLFLCVGIVILLWLVLEKSLKSSLYYRMINGARSSWIGYLLLPGRGVHFMLYGVMFSSLICLILWSITQSWRFPNSLPLSYTLRYWEKGITLSLVPIGTTLMVALAAVLIALIISIGCLEHENVANDSTRKIHSSRLIWILYTPLLIPQISFLFGIQIITLILKVDARLVSLVAVHLIFVFPYVFLCLAETYRKYDERYMIAAISMTGSRIQPFFKIKLVMLTKPILFSAAIGFAVSVAQYLPTLYIGGGRFSTITTETVSIATGADRRIISVYALLQLILPLMIYLLALVLPRLMFNNRKEMQN